MASNKFFPSKEGSSKTWYMNYNNKLLAIAKVFKTRRYYPKGCKYEVFMLINDNNL